MSFFKSTQHQVEDNHSVQDKSNYVPQHPLLQQYNARELVYGSENEYSYSSEDYSSDDDYGYYSEGFIPSEYISSSEDEYGYYSDGNIPESFEVAEGRRWNSAKGWTRRKKAAASKQYRKGKKQYRKGKKKYKKVMGNRAGRQRSGMKSMMSGKNFSSRINFGGKRGSAGRKRQRQKKRMFERKKERELEKRHGKYFRQERAKEKKEADRRLREERREREREHKREKKQYKRDMEQHERDMEQHERDMEKYEKGMKKHNRLSKLRLFARRGRHTEEEGGNNDSNESHPSGDHAKKHDLHLFGGHAKNHKLLESHLSIGIHTKKRHSDRPLEEAYEMPTEWSDQTIKQLFERLEKFKKHKHSGSTEEKNNHKKPNVKKSGFGKIASAFGSKIPKKPQKPAPKPVPKHLCLNESKIKKGVPIYKV